MNNKVKFSTNTVSNQNLTSFVPAIVMEYLMAKMKNNEIRKLPEKQSFNSVVMFADISGFTNLSEKLSKKGVEGSELLAFTLNRYMELLVKAIGRSGGDIFKFAGDAMIVLWPPSETEEGLTTLCRQAIQSALDMQTKLHGSKLVEDISLSVKVGFGIGTVTILHVGGVFQRAEYLAAGDPLIQAFECEHLAQAGGVVIVCRPVWEIVKKYFDFENIDEHTSSQNGPFFYVKRVKKDQIVKMKADAILIKNRLNLGEIDAIKPALQSYVPAAVVPFIELDQERWSGELRKLTVMFVNLGIDLTLSKTDKGLERIQLVIETVQKCVYMNQGSLNKLLMDDKGSTLIVVFGLFPMYHQDDAVRGVLTGLSLVKNLNQIHCKCSIGVTTGEVFCGVVGTSGSRREYSILGDSVNLSARFMQAACYEKDQKVLVDNATKKEAEHKLAFKFLYAKPVKGKTGEIEFFAPIHFSDEDVRLYPYCLRTHYFTPQKNGATDPKSLHMFGNSRHSELKSVEEDITEFMKNPGVVGPLLILIKGSYGIGKTLFVRNLIENISKKLENKIFKHNEYVNILYSTLNCSTETLKMNGFRQICFEILTRLSVRTMNASESILIQILQSDSTLLENIDLAQDILNLHLKKKKKIETQNTKITKQNNKILIKILCKLMQAYLEENSESLTDKNSSSEEENNGDKKRDSEIKSSLFIKNTETTPPLFLVLDDMQAHDPISFSFLKFLLKNVKKLIVIGVYRTEYIEMLPVFMMKDKEIPSQETIADERLSTLEEIGNEFGKVSIIELEGLEREALEKLIEVYFGAKQILTELPQTEIHETETKSPPISPSKKSIFRKKDSVKKDLDPRKSKLSEITNSKFDFVKFLIDKFGGHPLMCIDIIQVLLKNNYCAIVPNQEVFMIKEPFLKCAEIDEYLTLEPPLCCNKINGPILDHLDCPTYLLMKAACVIGQVFDLHTLLIVNPFKVLLPKDRIITILADLEESEFLEVLDCQDNNVVYRFSNPFIRETLYQRLLYNHRRQFHRFVAEAIQDVSNITSHFEKLECEKLIYHWCLAEDINIFNQQKAIEPPENLPSTSSSKLTSMLRKSSKYKPKESIAMETQSFSSKAKRSIIVKKISSTLIKNQNKDSTVLLKKGTIEKQSDKGSTWAKRFCILNNREMRYYYHEDQFKENPEEALGTMSLKHIFSIMPLREGEVKKKHGFIIQTGSWQKKHKDMGIRDFYFSASNDDDLEEWTTYIEFLRAKAIYDDFVNTFGKISFPLVAPQGLSDSSILADQNTEAAKKLKERLMKFVMVSQNLLVSQIIQNSIPNGKRKNDMCVVGQSPNIFKAKPQLLNFDPKIWEDPPKVSVANLNNIVTDRSKSITSTDFESPKKKSSENFESDNEEDSNSPGSDQIIKLENILKSKNTKNVNPGLEMIEEVEERSSIQIKDSVNSNRNKDKEKSKSTFSANIESLTIQKAVSFIEGDDSNKVDNSVKSKNEISLFDINENLNENEKGNVNKEIDFNENFLKFKKNKEIEIDNDILEKSQIKSQKIKFPSEIQEKSEEKNLNFYSSSRKINKEENLNYSEIIFNHPNNNHFSYNLNNSLKFNNSSNKSKTLEYNNININNNNNYINNNTISEYNNNNNNYINNSKISEFNNNYNNNIPEYSNVMNNNLNKSQNNQKYGFAKTNCFCLKNRLERINEGDCLLINEIDYENKIANCFFNGIVIWVKLENLLIVNNIDRMMGNYEDVNNSIYSNSSAKKSENKKLLVENSYSNLNKTKKENLNESNENKVNYSDKKTPKILLRKKVKDQRENLINEEATLKSIHQTMTGSYKNYFENAAGEREVRTEEKKIPKKNVIITPEDNSNYKRIIFPSKY